MWTGLHRRVDEATRRAAKQRHASESTWAVVSLGIVAARPDALVSGVLSWAHLSSGRSRRRIDRATGFAPVVCSPLMDGFCVL